MEIHCILCGNTILKFPGSDYTLYENVICQTCYVEKGSHRDRLRNEELNEKILMTDRINNKNLIV